MTLSNNAERLISVIEQQGYKAYAVGGCVRDYLLGRDCDDVDIATSATPFDIEQILTDNCISFIETGLKHGTVTALLDGESFEITTYRTDGSYLDSRHPENVSFVTNLREDLSRRDFTINALAYNDSRGIVDAFGGQQDIKDRLIRAVGDPDTRFKEDALRIMRAIRFSSVLSFEIESKTKKALFNNKELLKNVSVERLFAELSKLLLGDNVFNTLVEYRDIIAVIIPELEAIFNVPQNTNWHIYDVWEHTCKSVECAPKDLSLRLTMLLHDIGKAYTKTTDALGFDHFRGHQQISAYYAEGVLKRFKVSNEIFNRVMSLVPIHDMHIGTDEKKIKRWLSKVGEAQLRDLVEVKRADKLAQNPKMTQPELEKLNITESLIDIILSKGEPFSVKDLAVNGNDLIALGYKGKEIGECLNTILNAVIDGKVENDKSKLIVFIKNN